MISLEVHPDGESSTFEGEFRVNYGGNTFDENELAEVLLIYSVYYEGAMRTNTIEIDDLCTGMFCFDYGNDPEPEAPNNSVLASLISILLRALFSLVVIAPTTFVMNLIS